jgi:hypothetical protein
LSFTVHGRLIGEPINLTAGARIYPGRFPPPAGCGLVTGGLPLPANNGGSVRLLK